MHLKVDLIRLGYLSIIYLLSYCNGTVCLCITDEEKPRTINNFYAKSATVPTSSATAPVAVTQTRLEHSSAVGNNHSLTADVIWALKVVTAHYSYHSCETIAPLFALVKDAVADKLLLSKLAAFMSIAIQLQPFLTAFQSDNPLMPFVCGELSSIVRALMKRIVKPDILDEATNTTRLLAIKYKEPANCLHPKKFDVGYLAGASTKELLRKKEISEGALLRFRNELAAFVCAVISKIIEKTPIGYTFARRLACLDPVSIATNTTQAAIQFKLVVDYLVKQQL